MSNIIVNNGNSLDPILDVKHELLGDKTVMEKLLTIPTATTEVIISNSSTPPSGTYSDGTIFCHYE